MASTRWIKCIYCAKRIPYGSRTMASKCLKSPDGRHEWTDEKK